MKQIHELLLQMLREIDDICRKNDITYYAAGGTTLGAIRHKGFIPWDDDADIYMTRDEFSRFREAVAKETLPGRKLECTEDNPEYPALTPRYVNTETTNIAKFNVLDTCAAGLFIDIFILDPITSDPEEQRRRRNYLYIYSDFVNPYYGYSYRCDLDFFDEYRRYRKKADTDGVDAVKKELEEMLFTDKEKDSRFYMLRWGTIPHVFPIEMMGAPEHAPFEDMEVPIPAMWYEYLVKLYGVKWYVFPENIEEEGHNVICDLGTPYDVYMRDASDYIDFDLLKETMPERKDHLVEYSEMRIPYSTKVFEARSRHVIHKIEKRMADGGISLKDLYESRKYDEILEIFDDYLSVQFSREMIGAESHTVMYRYHSPFLIPLSDDQLYYILRTLLDIDEIDKVRRILDIAEKTGSDRPFLDEIRSDVDAIVRVMKAYYTGDPEGANEMLAAIPKDEQIRNMTLTRLKEQIGSTPESMGRAADELPSPLDGRDGPDAVTLKNIELLGELDSICKGNDIKYSLALDTLLYGAVEQGFESKYAIPTIMMTPGNAKRFIDLFEASCPADRRIVYMGNGSSHYENRILYCDETTARVDMYKNTYDNMHAIIVVLEQTPSGRLRRKLSNWIDRAAYIDSAKKDPSRELPSGIKGAIEIGRAGFLKRVCGGSRFYEKLFSRKIGSDDPKKGYVVLKRGQYRKPDYVIPGEMINDLGSIDLYGQELSIVSDWTGYVQRVYGKYKTESLEHDDEEQVAIVIDPSESLDVVEQLIGSELKTCDELSSYIRSYSHTIPSRRASKVLLGNFMTIRRTEERIRLARKYVPQKDKVLDLVARGKWTELEAMLEDYDRTARSYNRSEKALFFDKDIFDAYIAYLDIKGEQGFIDKIRDNIEKEELKPLDRSTLDRILDKSTDK